MDGSRAVDIDFYQSNLNSPSITIYQCQLEAASPEALLRLAKYLNLKNFYDLEHQQLAFIVSLVIADQYLNSCYPAIAKL
jgi:hypothetical protein